EDRERVLVARELLAEEVLDVRRLLAELDPADAGAGGEWVRGDVREASAREGGLDLVPHARPEVGRVGRVACAREVLERHLVVVSDGDLDAPERIARVVLVADREPDHGSSATKVCGS